jgi:hypothetical protein
MRKPALTFCSAALVLILAGCGGGGGSTAAPPPSNNGGANASLVPEDLFNLNGSDLLETLELDAGFSATSAVPQQADASVISPQVAGPFVAQISGGTAMVARNGNAVTPAIGFIMTYRDPSGLCECSNDNPLLKPPYKTSLTNPNWHASPFGTAASSTTLGIGMKNNTDSADHGGTYTATVANPPGGSATFSILNNAVALPRQSVPTITTNGGTLTATWVPAAGTQEYFLAFLTHLNNDPVHNKGFNVVGFVLTDKTSVTLPLSDFYSKAQYEALLISSDTKYINVYLSQGSQQAPALPSQLNFTVSQLLLFNTP